MKPQTKPIPMFKPTSESSGSAKHKSFPRLPPPHSARCMRTQKDSAGASRSVLTASASFSPSFSPWFLSPALPPPSPLMPASGLPPAPVLPPASLRPGCVTVEYASRIGRRRMTGSSRSCSSEYAENSAAIPRESARRPHNGAAMHQLTAPHDRAPGAAPALPAQASERMTKASTSVPQSLNAPTTRQPAWASRELGARVSDAIARLLTTVSATKRAVRRLPSQSASEPSIIGAKKRTTDDAPPSTPRSWVPKPFCSSQRYR
mmetsp:Transcript_3186/g.10123  ORF Transcript_3186/g.10123 Transcript_3186/m.10123 type:complete len:262 (+) Transcript_3186:3039-3824(+)